MKKDVLVLLIYIFVFYALSGCNVKNDIIMPEVQNKNLQKVCKVWGFTKYTHKTFLLGLKDWDEELLKLIPDVLSSGGNEVNDILYEWFVGLGENGYSSQKEASLIAETDENNLRYMANTGWITEEYLGEPLAMVLLRFQEISDINRSAAPVFFDSLNNSVHSNEKNYNSMDYSDTGYRLLGLFRLWNAIEYYFPYMDILDYDWNVLLLEHIQMMLNGADKQSYELTLSSLALKLDDAHVMFKGVSTSVINERYKQAWLNANYKQNESTLRRYVC